MKFLDTLGFFASAMALATPPVEKKDGVSISDLQRDVFDVNTSQELEAAQHKSLNKRVGAYNFVHIPIWRSGNPSYHILDVTIRFMMTETIYRLRPGVHGYGRLCNALQLINSGPHNVLVFITDVVGQGRIRSGPVMVPRGQTGYLGDMRAFTNTIVKVWVCEMPF